MLDKHVVVGGKLTLVEALKLLVIVLGVISVVLGFHGHYDFEGKELMESDRFVESCKMDDRCPLGSLKMEHIFLSLSTILLLLSIFNFIYSLAFDITRGRKAIINLIYEFGSGVLLVMGGILILISSIGIHFFIANQLIREKDGDDLGCFTSTLLNGTNTLIYSCPVFFGNSSLSLKSLDLGMRFPAMRIDYAFPANEHPDSSTIHSKRLSKFTHFSKFHEKNFAGILSIISGGVSIGIAVLLIMGKGEGKGVRIAPGETQSRPSMVNRKYSGVLKGAESKKSKVDLPEMDNESTIQRNSASSQPDLISKQTPSNSIRKTKIHPKRKTLL